MKAVRVVGMAASQPAEGTSDYASGRLYEQTRNGISLALDTDSPQTRTAMTCAVHAITMISMMKIHSSPPVAGQAKRSSEFSLLHADSK
jgi:hypothetical protein